MEASQRPRWWVIAVAAVLAALFLFNYTGSWAGVGLIGVAIAGCLAWQAFRAMKPAEPRAIRCVKCGETLNPTARRCDSCGSASWTLRS